VPRHEFFHTQASYVSAVGLASSEVNEYGVPIKDDFVVAVGTTFDIPAVSLLHFPNRDNFTRSWSQRNYDSGLPALSLGVENAAFVLVIKSIAQVEDDGDNVWTHRDRVVNEYDLARARFGNATFSAGGVRAHVESLDGVFNLSWELIDSDDPTDVVVGIKLTLRNFTLEHYPRKTYVGIRAYLAHRDVKLHVDSEKRVVESHSVEPMYFIWHKHAHGPTQQHHWDISSYSTCHGTEFNPLRWIEDAQVRAIARASRATRVTEMTFLFLGGAPATRVIEEMTWESTLTWFDKDPEARSPIGLSAVLLVMLIVAMSFCGVCVRRSPQRREERLVRALIAPS
jgi:hypothetical protein